MVNFPDSLTVENINPFYKKLLTAYKGAGEDEELTIELSSLSYVDFSGVQLIASFCKTIIDEGRTVVVKGVSPAVEQAFSYSGLDKYIGKGGEPQ